MKTYNIQNTRIDGKLHKRIRFSKNYKNIFDLSWLPEDKESEARNIRSADIFVLKNPELGFSPKKLKKS